MNQHLSGNHFPAPTAAEAEGLESSLRALLDQDLKTDLLATLAGYQRVLADNSRRDEWPAAHAKLELLFKCGECAPLDGPMIGIPVGIRDSDYFKGAASRLGKKRSVVAGIEFLATAWNATFADTGLWMGKTYEPVSRDEVKRLTDGNPAAVKRFDPATTRIGRNFFREPPDPNPLQAIGLPALTPLWRLQERPRSTAVELYPGELLEANLDKEKSIPYSRTGGLFLADVGPSVVPEMNGKKVYQLNYRWPALGATYPMTCLVDEIVRLDDGVYLGQLVLATRRFSVGGLTLTHLPSRPRIELGEAYRPHRSGLLARLQHLFFPKRKGQPIDYGYQNNGFFLMIDTALARRAYDDDVFPQLRPRPGESGYLELGYDRTEGTAITTLGAAGEWGECTEWVHGWADNDYLREKFTTFILETPPGQTDTAEVAALRQDGESILQMLQRLSREISATTRREDHLRHFESLNMLFRAGVAPTIQDGLFQGHGPKGYNFRLEGRERRDWYGEEERSTGFDFYHGAALNLHWGFADTRHRDRSLKLPALDAFPSALADILGAGAGRHPNVMDIVWHSIGKYVFPWAGKSFEKIAPRKLSMLLDESPDLAERYPKRVRQLERHLASAPHYDLVKKNAAGHWSAAGPYAAHLANGSWDRGMSAEDRDFWRQQAATRWSFGTNIEDRRILLADAIMRAVDMNYRAPDPALKEVSERGPSPFARHGYIFLAASEQDSILEMNNAPGKKKRVFQFHYRYPMIGGPAPIGLCLDELVEIADGLFLGQLIYATALEVPFHSSVDPAAYEYALFGYFLLLDDAWEYHRQAIGLDTLDWPFGRGRRTSRASPSDLPESTKPTPRGGARPLVEA